MPQLQLLRPDHAPALLAFEQENRAYFAASVPDRGDAYLAGFAGRHSELLGWQAGGTGFFHVLVEEDGAIVGRVNQAAGGRRVGGAWLPDRRAGCRAGPGHGGGAAGVCALAVADYGLRVLRAAARLENAGSRTVLIRTGFVPTGEVVPSGRPGTTCRLVLTESEPADRRRVGAIDLSFRTAGPAVVRNRLPSSARTLQSARSGYFERMARPRRPESVLVPIGLKVSEADAARIDQVLARPEYAGWTRAEWCREIVRSALRYYVGEDPGPDPGQAHGAVRPAAEKPVPSSQPPRAAASPPDSVAGASDPAVVPSGSESGPAMPGSPTRSGCPHPADARDYETGTCAACGAILWD